MAGEVLVEDESWCAGDAALSSALGASGALAHAAGEVGGVEEVSGGALHAGDQVVGVADEAAERAGGASALGEGVSLETEGAHDGVVDGEGVGAVHDLGVGGAADEGAGVVGGDEVVADRAGAAGSRVLGGTGCAGVLALGAGFLGVEEEAGVAGEAGRGGGGGAGGAEAGCGAGEAVGGAGDQVVARCADGAGGRI